MNARDFHVRPGDSIARAIRALAAHILREARLTTGAGVRRHQTAEGSHIVADARSPAFGGSFTVAMRGARACTVGHGTVNGAVVPVINGVPVDGVIQGRALPPPVLALASAPDAARRSWVCLRATPAPDAAAMDGRECLYEIAHITDASLLDGRDDDMGRGHHPLAMLVWADAASVSRVVRAAYFNVRHTRDAVARVHSFIPAP